MSFVVQLILLFVSTNVFLCCDSDIIGTVGNANNFVDQLIQTIRPLLKEKGVDTISAVNVSEIVRYLNITGLSSISRADDATLKVEGQSIVLETHLGFFDIVVFYHFHQKLKWFLNIGVKGNTTTSYISAFIKFRLLLLGNLQMIVEEFKITDWGNLKVKLTGENFLGNIAGYFIDWNFFQRLTTRKLKEEVPPEIKSEIQDFLQKLGLWNPSH